MREVTYGSLFSGIGGMDLGLEMASNDRVRFVCKWQVENNKYAQKVLEKHWPGVQREEDVRFAGAANLPRVDVIIGGFPCQDISYAGKGAGLAGERSGLWHEFARVIRELEPRVVVVENVRALLTRGIDSVLGTLASLGFDAEWHCVPACSVGAPHIRDRVFILAHSQRDRWEQWGAECKGQQRCSTFVESSSHVADTNHRGISRRWCRSSSCSERCDTGRGCCDGQRSNLTEETGQAFPNTHSPRLEGQRQIPSRTTEEHRDACYSRWWETEPAVGELVNGLSGGLVRFEGRTCGGTPDRVQKLRGLGNAVVPQVMQLVGTWVREMFDE